MVIDELTRTGVMEPGRLFESPFTDVAPAGLQSLFGQDGATQLTLILEHIRRTASEPVPAGS